MPLEKELETFEKLKEQLLQNYSGKFALIKEDQFIGAFDTAENAYREGVQKFGRDPFLVKRITEPEEVYKNHALANGLIYARI